MYGTFAWHRTVAFQTNLHMTSSHNEELFLAIGRLEGKVDSLLSMHSQHTDALKEHDERIRSLEYSRGYMLGWSAAIGAGMSLAASFLIRAFT